MFGCYGTACIIVLKAIHVSTTNQNLLFEARVYYMNQWDKICLILLWAAIIVINLNQA